MVAIILGILVIPGIPVILFTLPLPLTPTRILTRDILVMRGHTVPEQLSHLFQPLLASGML